MRCWVTPPMCLGWEGRGLRRIPHNGWDGLLPRQYRGTIEPLWTGRPFPSLPFPTMSIDAALRPRRTRRPASRAEDDGLGGCRRGRCGAGLYPADVPRPGGTRASAYPAHRLKRGRRRVGDRCLCGRGRFVVCHGRLAGYLGGVDRAAAPMWLGEERLPSRGLGLWARVLMPGAPSCGGDEAPAGGGQLARPVGAARWTHVPVPAQGREKAG